MLILLFTQRVRRLHDDRQRTIRRFSFSFSLSSFFLSFLFSPRDSSTLTYPAASDAETEATGSFCRSTRAKGNALRPFSTSTPSYSTLALPLVILPPAARRSCTVDRPDRSRTYGVIAVDIRAWICISNTPLNLQRRCRRVGRILLRTSRRSVFGLLHFSPFYILLHFNVFRRCLSARLGRCRRYGEPRLARRSDP